MSIKFLMTALLIGLLLIIATSGQTTSDWEKSNGGWIVVKNSHVYNTGGPFHPCPEQTGCKGYPIHVEHGVCINAVTFDNPSVGASWTPPDNNIILAKDCGTNEWMRVDCPVVTKFWVPAGTYTLTEFAYVSEVNPGDPSYSPCSNTWSKTPKTVVIKPGDTVDFGEYIFPGDGTCIVGGYPCHSGPLGSGSGGCHQGWTGKWDTTWGEMDFEHTEIAFLQTGNTVTGTYPYDQGKIQGTILGNKLIGTWSESPSYSSPNDAGDLEFTMSDDCKSFSGKYRYGSSGSWKDWAGTLKSSEPTVTAGSAIGEFAAGATKGETDLTPGWDDFNQPLDYGKVAWHYDETQSELHVSLSLMGALPNHDYTVGVHLFNKDDLTKHPSDVNPGVNEFFGKNLGSDCIEREGTSACVDAFDFGTLSTDEVGSGEANFVGYVPTGETYYVQFTVRIGECPGSGCDAVYRTGSKFAQSFEEIKT